MRGVNKGMQIRRSVLFFGPISQSDVILFKSGSALLKNFPWFKFTAYRYIYLFSFSFTVFRFCRKFSVFSGVSEKEAL